MWILGKYVDPEERRYEAFGGDPLLYGCLAFGQFTGETMRS
jgi:hypothetical protein